MAMWHYSCTMVTRLLICVAKSGGQGPDSDRILMSSVSVELSGRESSESSANCCEVMSIM